MLQSCPTPCDPIDGSPPGSPVPGILQARTLEWGATAFSVSSFTAPLFFCLQASPASGSFPMSWLTRWPKYWSFSFSISPSSEHSVLISLRINWLELLAVQGTLESFLQHHNSKASVFRCSAFFVVQLSHPYMTTGKTIALTRWTFVVKVMSLLSGLSLFSFRCELLVTSYLGAADDM